MTPISEMNDDDLRLAIAEELGMQVHISDRGRFRYWLNISKGKQGAPRIRNWPCDVAAAMFLPLETNDEKRKFAIELAKIVIPDINIGTAGIVYEAAFATARQRSEAWLTARRNDG